MTDREILSEPKETNKSCVVLLSSGLDSAVNLFLAKQKMPVRLVLTFDYGQRAAKKEIEKSRAICAMIGVEHKVIELPFFSHFSKSALNNLSIALPTDQEVEINNLQISQKTARAVWVPNRNGIFLNIAAAYAESLGADYVVPGFNSEEAATFPDNSGEFLRALNQSFFYSTSSRVRTLCFTAELNKSDIVILGRELGVPFAQLWPCYQDGDVICGQCESCQRFLRAVEVTK